MSTEFIFVSGNKQKIKYFNLIMGLDFVSHNVDITEIQSLDPLEIIEHKAREAFRVLKSPVVVEDASFGINHMGKLPGTFIKWFIEQIGIEKICRLADPDPTRAAYVQSAIALYDGKKMQTFLSGLAGSVAQHRTGDFGFGWNQIFIPEGQNLTLGQMDQSTFLQYYRMIKPFDQTKKAINSWDN